MWETQAACPTHVFTGLPERCGEAGDIDPPPLPVPGDDTKPAPPCCCCRRCWSSNENVLRLLLVLPFPPPALAHGGDRLEAETPPTPGGVRTGDIGDVGDMGAGPRAGETAGESGFPKGALLLNAAGSTVWLFSVRVRARQARTPNTRGKRVRLV